jgi:hypothetical protein
VQFSSATTAQPSGGVDTRRPWRVQNDIDHADKGSWRPPLEALPSEIAAALVDGRISRPHHSSCTWLSICRRFCGRDRSVGRSGRCPWAFRQLLSRSSDARQPLGSVRSCSWLSPRWRKSQNVTLVVGLHTNHLTHSRDDVAIRLRDSVSQTFSAAAIRLQNSACE